MKITTLVKSCLIAGMVVPLFAFSSQQTHHIHRFADPLQHQQPASSAPASGQTTSPGSNNKALTENRANYKDIIRMAATKNYNGQMVLIIDNKAGNVIAMAHTATSRNKPAH